MVSEILLENTEPTSSDPIVDEKNLTFNKFDEGALLSKLKQNQRRKALDILKHMKEQPDQLSFDESGTVFIEGNALPQSNVYKLLQDLFCAKSKGPGFNAFVLKLQQMGLSRYIPKKSIPEPELGTVNKPHSSYNLEQWYYLGP